MFSVTDTILQKYHGGAHAIAYLPQIMQKPVQTVSIFNYEDLLLKFKLNVNALA